MKKAVCKVEGCIPKYPGWRGYCGMHYQRWRMHGDPLIVKPSGFQSDDTNPGKRPTWRQKLSQFRKGTPTPEHVRRKQADTMRRVLADPAMREKWQKARLGKSISTETRKKIAEAHSKKPKKLSTLIHNADRIFSLYIRSIHADGRGNCSCFTCDVVKPIAEMDCGHFVSRQHKSTRWMEKNCHPQCRYCNRYNEGRKDVYSVRLIQKYGAQILLELQEEKNRIKKWTAAELQELIQTYKGKLSELGTSAQPH